MCYYYAIDDDMTSIELYFDATFDQEEFSEREEVNGFTHPYMPIIVDERPDIITGAHWGLLPSWAKDISFQKNTLNARIETIDEKPSFRNVIKNRCIIPATSFFEWQWLDDKGKRKQKYTISAEDEKLMAFAGLYSVWKNPANGNQMLTYTILTTAANELMAEIHNIKKRMPVILHKEHYMNWLQGEDYRKFAFPYEVKLTATAI